MIKEARLSLIERAAGRLDLRALAASPIPFAPATTKSVSEATSFAETAGPPPHHEIPSDGVGISAVIEEPPRRPAKPPSVSFDRARLRKLALVDWAAGRTRAAEEFRIIKRQLLEQAADPERCGPRCNLIMITSVRPREGRTFTALNLAISIAAERNWHVLLVDACDDENTVASVVQTASPPGWLDLVEDPTLDMAGAVLETDIPRLSVMLPGRPEGRHGEPLASGNMQRLLEELSGCNRNRVVLIDAPSCLDTSDPAMLARVVGQTVLVVEAHATQQQGVEAALELLHPCENTYLVLNKNRTS
jgi:protein-tyrosine kinase